MLFKILNSRYIKLLAVITMTFDHVGYMLYPGVIWLRIIGRISMPLFCLLVAYGSTKTKNQFKYALRLFVFAVVVQAGFNIFQYNNIFAFENWNIFFSLAIGAGAICFIKWQKDVMISFIGVCALLGLSLILPLGESSYSIAGIVLILLFYLSLMHSVIMLKVTALFSLLIFNGILFYLSGWAIQWYSMLSLIFILFFADCRLKISVWEKYFFYLYYPLHFIVIYCISLFLL